MKEKISFEAHHKTFKEILFATDKYVVPRYQRPYAWGEEEVSDFWEDLMQPENTYFIGSFIFNNETKDKSGFIEIIDGQQRILTVTVFMAVLRDVVREIDPERAERIQRQDIAFEDREGKHSYRITPAESLSNFFKTYIQTAGNNIDNAENLTGEEERVKKNYNYLKKKVASLLATIVANEKKLEKIDCLRDRVANLMAIKIEIHNEEDAYEIFETTNARGAELSVADLLKNMIFKKLPPKENKDLAKEVWKEIWQNVDETGTEIKKFIRYFWISRCKFVQEKQIYRQIKTTTTDWNKLLKDLKEDSEIYNLIYEGDQEDFSELGINSKIYEAIFALRIMRVSQCYVFLLSVLRNLKQLGTDPTNIIKFIEKFTFQYSVVSKLPANRIEKIYSKYAIKIEAEITGKVPDKKTPGDIQRIFAELQKELKAEAPSESVFMDGFKDISYRNSEESRRIIKYILGKIDESHSETKEKKIDYSVVNIEHVLPKDPETAWGLTKKDIKSYVNRLGNLTLLSKRLNSKMQNSVIKKKLPDLKRSELKLTSLLVQDLERNGLKWDKNEITRRHSELGDISYNKIWTINS